MAEPTVLFVTISMCENEPDGLGKKTIGINEEMKEGYEERIMLKLAHALGFDDATSVEIITPDGRFD